MPNVQSFGEDVFGDAPDPRFDGSLPSFVSTQLGTLNPAYGTIDVLDKDIFEIGRLQGGSTMTFRIRPFEWDSFAFEDGLDTAEISILAEDGTEVASSSLLYLPTAVTFNPPFSSDYYLLLEGGIASSGQYSISMDYAGTASPPKDDPPPSGNRAPQAAEDSATTLRDTAVTLTTSDLTGNDSDPDDDTLSVASVGNASDGTVVLNSDGTVTFTPDAGFAGAGGFDYTVSDGRGGEDTARVDVTVQESSTAPASTFIYDYSPDERLYDKDIRGADGTPISADEAQVYRTYFGALDRKPDASGFEWWLNEIESGRKSLDDMAAGFFYSDEFQSQADGDGNGTVSDEEFIYHMYNGVFGREPDTEGFNYWLSELQSGARDEAEILSTMTQSDEYVQQTAYQVSLYDFI